ncbi:hypothetical protein SAMN05444359_12310 [Neolewinella agarilytica]|uniref:Uncharacterized protein n=1 Tax=Neolewinella agarilytica TaxID=478744 RepID=A0A1H9L5Q2_9BACT|nr:hypothetical protein SAMN05444359_12310 [Neolewinella agarilytica]
MGGQDDAKMTVSGLFWGLAARTQVRGVLIGAVETLYVESDKGAQRLWACCTCSRGKEPLPEPSAPFGFNA